ncbi:MAG: hypothetical protein JWN79_2496, partial [Gemmatimonadetes bacterium]|nr:hypothetical protein [Gemmatimonadota bacterium]
PRATLAPHLAYSLAAVNGERFVQPPLPDQPLRPVVSGAGAERSAFAELAPVRWDCGAVGLELQAVRIREATATIVRDRWRRDIGDYRYGRGFVANHVPNVGSRWLA